MALVTAVSIRLQSVFHFILIVYKIALQATESLCPTYTIILINKNLLNLQTTSDEKFFPFCGVIQGLSRGCNSRYKIAEFRVYGSIVSGSRHAAPSTTPKTETPLLSVEKKKNAITSSLKVYPNPTSHSLTIDMTRINGGVQRIELIDNLGKPLRIVQFRLQKAVATIDVSGLPSGFYLLKAITNGQQVETQKMLIRH